MVFLDEARLHVLAGRGGNGCVAFRREKFVPRGGPAGGDGGDGGSVVIVGDEGLNTLYHLRHTPQVKAERGRHGEGSNRTGRSGE
ncbi:MAG: GTPase ObgE, partial [Thermoanaerobaculia bacterium]|nr:GTPase ObgE [Thermoanaerobaculia bacterium]